MDTDEALTEIHRILLEALQRIRRLEKELMVVRADINHGTRMGYEQHRRHGITPCEACRRANADHQRKKRALKTLI